MGRLLLLRKRYLFRDTFGGAVGAALSSQWTAALGAFDLDGSGRVRGKTLAVDGIQLVTNPEFTTVTTGWTAMDGSTLTRRDCTSSPDIDPTGGTDDFALEVQNGGGECRGGQTLATVPGISYTASCRAYAPSANTTVNAARLGWVGNADIAVEDAWATLARTPAATAATHILSLYCLGATSGDKTYFDAISAQATLAIATHDLGRASHDLRIRFVTPASGIVPGGYLVRYQDASNYWLWRIKPGTAGNDLELVEVNAGVATVRAAADIDWAASTTYDLRLLSQANVYTAYVNNVSKATYTDAGNFLATNTKIGLWSAGAANILTDQLIAKAA